MYRLSHWKAAADEINYRRFFDINDLAAVCMEDPDVFAESHRLVFELLVRGDVDGLRIDHIDGLYEPTEYLRRLQGGYLRALGMDYYRRSLGTSGPPSDAPAKATGAARRRGARSSRPSCQKVTALSFADRATLPLYVVVEKILGPDEALPEEWLLAGTTGYDFLNAVGGLFVEPAGLAELTKTLRPLHRRAARFPRGGPPVETADLSHGHVERFAVVGPPAQSHLRAASALAGFHAQYVADCAAGDPGLLSRLPHVHSARAPFPSATGRCCAGRRRRPSAATRRVDAAVFDFIRDVLLLEAPARG